MESKNSSLTKNVLCMTPLMAYCRTPLSHVVVTNVAEASSECANVLVWIDREWGCETYPYMSNMGMTRPCVGSNTEALYYCRGGLCEKAQDYHS